MKKEIEILVELHSDFDAAQAILSKYPITGIKRTIDRYFYDPLRSSLQLNENNKILECCRVREKGDKSFLTYKTDVYDSDIWLYSNENEVECSHPKNLIAILESLHLKHLVTVNSEKHIYNVLDYEIVLERVEGLGAFLEVEYTSEEEFDVNVIKARIRDFISLIGLMVGEELNSGKPELLLIKQKQLGI